MASKPVEGGYETIVHTADQGVRVFGPTPEAIFRHAGRALFELMVDAPGVARLDVEEFVVEGEGWGDLLHNYLSELLYLFAADGFVAASFEFEDLAETRLLATVAGEPFDPARHVLLTEIKAVTYHRLRMEPKDDGWEAVVIFDL